MRISTRVSTPLLVIVGAIALFYFLSLSSKLEIPSEAVFEEKKSEIIEIYLEKTKVFADVVKTQSAIERGLSGRENLLSNHGMLFIFSTPDRYGFWMKEMKFPIDILWLSNDGSVMHTEEGVSPETYPQTFAPKSGLARYVLELPAGYSREHQVEIGDKIDL